MNTLKEKRKLLVAVILLMFCLSAIQIQTYASENVIAATMRSNTAKGKLLSTDKGIRYRYEDGSYAKGCWLSVKEQVYYFSTKGYAKTGWFYYHSHVYYADAKGRVKYNTWLKKDGKKYYLRYNGFRIASNWLKKDGNVYYFNSKGVLQASKMFRVKDRYYYADRHGVRKSSCWVTIGTDRYFFGSNGVRYENKWVKYNGKYYYLGPEGAMLRDCYVGSYYVGSDGAREDFGYGDGYYIDPNGVRIEGRKTSAKYLFVGDSRTVGLQNTVSMPTSISIGKVSMGYQWLVSTAGPQVEKYLAGNKDLTVIFGFGINDMGNIQSYISYYRRLEARFPHAKICYMSVNPVNESVGYAHGYRVNNDQIRAFNDRFLAAINSGELKGQYLNSYVYLKAKSGFSTADGIHYTAGTYQTIYDFVMRKLKKLKY